MNQTSSQQTNENTKTPRFHPRTDLEAFHFLRSKRRLFRRYLTDKERETAADAATRFELDRDNAKERGKGEAKWVSEVLLGIDPESRLACEEEMEFRKEIAGSEAKLAEARRREELRAAALGYRWDEVEVEEYADDHRFEIFHVRQDSGEEVLRRRMSEYEAKAGEERRQQRMFT